MSKKVKRIVFAPGPYATHFQEYRGDPYLGANKPPLDSFSQRPRVTLQDNLSNRMEHLKVLLAEEKD